MIARLLSARLAAVSPLALVVGAVVVVAPLTVQAQCITNAAGFRCTGIDPDGIEDRRPGIVGLIDPSAQVGGRVSVEVGDDATVLVGQDALLDGGDANNGIVAGDGVTVVNDGEIGRGFGFGARNAAIEAGDDATITNGATGTISPNGGIVFAGDGLRFTNLGEVRALAAGGRGISTDDDATIVNTGTFFSQENLISADDDLSLVNTGSMEGFNEGISASSRLRLVNSGAIRTLTFAVGGSEGSSVSNSGSIESGVSAISLGRDSVVENERGGVIRNDDDEVALRLGDDGVVSNQGLVEALGKDAIVGSGDLRVANGAEDEAAPGTILAAQDAVRAAGDIDLDNVGEITAGGDAVVAGGDASVANLAGSIVAGDRAVVAGGRASVSVLSDITAGGVGIEGGDGSSINVTSNDTVSAGGDAVRFGRGSSVFLDNNESTIETTGVGTTALTIVGGDIYNAFGNILAPRGVAIDVGFGAQGDAPAGDLDFLNFGDVVGLIGIRTAPGDTARQKIVNDGRIVGTSGVAIDFGGGDDLLEQLDAVSGDVLFGSGNDELVFFGNEATSEDLFDGGNGFDVARLFGVGSDEVLPLPINDGVVLTFLDDPARAPLTLRGFERLAFEDTTLTAGLAPIPLPAGLPMLAGALGGLFVLRRWRGRA